MGRNSATNIDTAREAWQGMGMTITVEQLRDPPSRRWDSEDTDRVSDWVSLFEIAGDTLPSEDSYNDPKISRALGSEVSISPVLRKDVAEIIAQHDSSEEGLGQWSGLIVVRTTDGRFAFIDAGCDTTGWDCQSGGHCIVSHDLEHLIRFGIGEQEREKLGLSLASGAS